MQIWALFSYMCFFIWKAHKNMLKTPQNTIFFKTGLWYMAGSRCEWLTGRRIIGKRISKIQHFSKPNKTKQNQPTMQNLKILDCMSYF